MVKDLLVLDLPIEPIETRYSAEWSRWYREAYERNGLDFVTCLGGDYAPPDSSKFLDPYGTFAWKFSQLRAAVDVVKQNQSRRIVVMAHDGWLPGLEMFAYLRDVGGARIKVASFWHAGSYDSTDLLARSGCWKWAEGSEKTWLRVTDLLVTGTQFHVDMIRRTRGLPARVVVTGYPIAIPPGYRESRREALVVWPHRLCPEKQPEVFDRLSKEPRFRLVEFVKTLEACKTKPQYHRLLGRAKVVVSTALQENFGIAMVEGAVMGAWPVCPSGISYDETMPESRLYSSYEELRHKVEAALNEDALYEYPFAAKYDQKNVLDHLCDELKKLGEE